MKFIEYSTESEKQNGFMGTESTVSPECVSLSHHRKDEKL